MQDIFGIQTAFDPPKPSRLIQRILQIATHKDSLILDSFAGSGTTGHAVDETKRRRRQDYRRFILVEMDSGIAQNVTAERVSRVAKGYISAKGQAVNSCSEAVSNFAAYPPSPCSRPTDTDPP